jgi:hypothetical protein
MSQDYATAAHAFQDALQRLTAGQEVLSEEEQERVGRRAARVAAAEASWKEHLGPLLGWEVVAEIIGVGTRQGVNDLARRQRILGLPAKDRRLLYPAFQFKGERPLPGLADVLPILLEHASEWTVASWLQSPQPELDDRSPVEALSSGDMEDLELVKLAADRTSARLRQ